MVGDEPEGPELKRIGAFGEEEPAAPERNPEDYGIVTYFGTDIRVIIDPLDLELTLQEFIDAAAQLDVDEDDPEVIGVIRKFARAIIHPDDFTKWWRVVRVKRQDMFGQMAFCKYVIETMTERPTGLPSGSSDGRQQTPGSAEPASSSPAMRRLEEQGRPDLASVILARREYLASQA